ncbi:MAG: GDP-mannose 4,6-dehydratase [Candidatus Wolfebacteria bacterium]|nr:GDP-mannose 4,6-dehydratase [Candidatus Wolfebacteria bacterium]
MKKALITGITGQDGSYLAEFLPGKGYEVHGLTRVPALENPEARFSRIGGLLNNKKIILHYGDVSDYPTVWRLIAKIKPDEVYHLAAISSIKSTFEDDFGTFKTNTDSAHYLLSAIKELAPGAKFYFAGSSEMFGHPKATPQDENTPFNPVSPYAISKLAGFNLVKMYREAYGIFACTGIAYNHESPRRGFEFVTRKIISTAAKIKLGLEKELKMGSLDSRRDWGYAGDFVEAMWLMLQADKADDYVIGTGINHTVQELIEITFNNLGLDWQKFVVIDKEFVRPPETFEFRANPVKIKTILGWVPKTSFEEMIKMMVDSDLKRLTK